MATAPQTTELLRHAAGLDAEDPLAGFAARFHLPRGAAGPALYFCGHSLGPQPVAAAAWVAAEMEAWAASAVEGHFTGARPWAEYAQPLAAASARLAGAEPEEVAVMHSLTVNLHLMLASFYRPEGARRRILIERPAFPSDRYALASQIRGQGFDPAEALVEVGPRAGEAAVRGEDLIEAIAREGPRLALVFLGGVNYHTGQAFPLAACARAAHEAGALAGFDLAHSIGNLPLGLHDDGADFAVWCGYKYLNGGPGAPGGAFVHRRHFSGGPPLPRLAGWWGHQAATRFEMRPGFEPAAGAAGWAVSCPSILSLAGLRAGLDIFDAAGMAAVRDKSLRLAAYFDQLADALLPRVTRLTPRAPGERGNQVSLDLGAGAAAAQQWLRQQGVYCDVRGAVLRLSFNPLYNSFQDVARGVKLLGEALA